MFFSRQGSFQEDALYPENIITLFHQHGPHNTLVLQSSNKTLREKHLPLPMCMVLLKIVTSHSLSAN
jgi:hypothetical protein